MLGEVERAEEGRRVHEGGEEREDGEDVKLGGEEHLGWVHVVPVTEFMCWRRVSVLKLSCLNYDGTYRGLPRLLRACFL